MMSALFFFFKQKTAYEMRISDWSSVVCSSDLRIYHQIYSNPIIHGLSALSGDPARLRAAAPGLTATACGVRSATAAVTLTDVTARTDGAEELAIYHDGVAVAGAQPARRGSPKVCISRFAQQKTATAWTRSSISRSERPLRRRESTSDRKSTR